MNVWLLLAPLGWLAWAQSANILAVFPFPAKSHHAVFQPIVVGLAQNHTVTYVTPNPISNPPANLKQITLTGVLKKLKEFHDNHKIGEKEDFSTKALKWLSDRWCNLLIRQAASQLTEDIVLHEPAFQELIKDTSAEYDLVLLETTFAQEAYATFAHKYGAPIVEVLPAPNLHWTYYLIGNPYDTSYIVDVEVHYSDHMSFLQRLINTAYSMLNRFSNVYYFMPKAQELADQHFRYPGWESRPPLWDIVKNTSLLLINSHVAVNYPYPLSPNVQLIGGINIQEKVKPLPKKFQKFMDEAEDGVIYFTFGSHLEVSSTLSENMTGAFLEAFGKLKQRVLWKWETHFPNLPTNIMISKWFPQQDILAHKNMKLFITHGGGLSTTESIYNGVPVIGIPILGDQPKNVNHAHVTGYGLHLDLQNLTETSISWAINELLSNPKYTEKARERSAIFKDKPEKPLDTAVYWIEYVLRHQGARHLRPAVADMPWWQQALLDVYLVMAALVLLPLLVAYKLVSAVFRCICCRNSNRAKNSKTKKE